MLVKKKIKENCSFDIWVEVQITWHLSTDPSHRDCKINNEDNITRNQVELDSKQCYNLKLQYASKLTTLK